MTSAHVHPLPAVLIVDDSTPVRLWLRRILQGQFLSLEASDTLEAEEILSREHVDLILLDYALPKGTGLDFCRKLRQLPHLSNVPILMVTANTEDRLIAEAFSAGFTDYVRKPLRPGELLARLSQALKNRALEEKASSLIRELKEKAERDPLTFLYNRLTLEKLALIEMAKARRTHQPLSLLMIDIDHFKSLNDRYGHVAGDEALAHLASFLVSHLRKYDIVCRYGGDEFVILLPNTSEEKAHAVANKLLHALPHHPCQSASGSFVISLSIGVARLRDNSVDESPQAFKQLLLEADAALYTAKQLGRGRAAHTQEGVSLC